MKKVLALSVGILLVGLAFSAAQEKTQEQAQAKTQLKAQTKVQAKAQTKAEFRHRNRIAFVDENGDGINDLARDADGDGIPNGQDPDWTNTAGRQRLQGPEPDPPGPDDTEMTRGQKTGKVTTSNFGKGSFRAGMTAVGRTTGAGVCDGTGPKGTIKRKGRG